jgi:hypothetical protein
MEHYHKLFPPIYQRQERLVNVVISTSFDIKCLKHVTVEVETNRVRGCGLHGLDDLDEYDDVIDLVTWFDRYIFNITKGFIINCFDTKSPNYSSHYSLREMAAKKLDSLKLPYYFTSPDLFVANLMLTAGNIVAKEGEIVLTICVSVDTLMAIELCRREDGYVIVRKQSIEIKNNDDWPTYPLPGFSTPNQIVAAIMFPPNTFWTPKTEASIQEELKNMIFTYKHVPIHEELKNILTKIIPKDAKNVTNIDGNITYEIPKLVNNLVEHMFDKTFDTYHIFPSNHATIAVSTKSNLMDIKDALMVVNEYEILPVKKSCIVERNNSSFYVYFLEEKKFQQIKNYDFKLKSCHQIKLELLINENNLPFLFQQEVTMPEITEMPTKLNANENINNLELFHIS